MNVPSDTGSSDAKRKTSLEVAKRGYSDDEVAHLFELGRLWLENGDPRRAESLMVGITEVAPDFSPGWLGLSYIHLQNRNYDGAIYAARQALRLKPDFVEAILYLVAALLTTGDINSAGTYLGEVGEMIESGAVHNPNVLRFYRAQLTRYQQRGTPVV